MADEGTSPANKSNMPSMGTTVPPGPNADERELIEMIRGLRSEEQAAVRVFVRRLRAAEAESAAPSFLSTVDEFIDEHPELLRQLAR